MKNGFFPIACATPPLRVADCTYNAEQIISLTREAAKNGSKLVVFPELCITGYTCGDLFLQQILLDGALQALRTILKETSDLFCICVVGLPIRHTGAIYNCAAVCYQGSVLGIVPKQHLPNYGEFYEQRHFTPGIPADGKTFWQADGIAPCPFGAQQLFQCAEAPDFTFGVELCEDVWVADTPSVAMARMGATLIVNLSCSDEIIGKAAYRRTILQAKSGSLLCAYAYADAGMGESTQDMVFAGHNLILENSAILAESKLFSDGLLYAEPDLQRMAAERQRSNSFQPLPLTTVCTRFFMPLTETALHRFFSPTPFVPAGAAELSERCETILTLQATGLATRLRHNDCQEAECWLLQCPALVRQTVLIRTLAVWQKPMGQLCEKFRFKRVFDSILLTLVKTNPFTMSPMKTVRQENGHKSSWIWQTSAAGLLSAQATSPNWLWAGQPTTATI